MLARFIQVMRLNLGIDLQSMMTTQPGFLPDPLWETTDVSRLRQGDRAYADHVFHLLCAVLAYAVAGTLQDGGRLTAFFPSETDQSFVDVRQISHSVSCPMIKIHFFLPEDLSRDTVQICSAASVKESCIHQTEHGPGH